MTITQILSIIVPVSVVVIAHVLSRMAAKSEHDKTTSNLHSIQVNVDGNLSKSLALTEQLQKDVAKGADEVAGLRAVVADQAKALVELTGAVKKNGHGEPHRRSTDSK